MTRVAVLLVAGGLLAACAIADGSSASTGEAATAASVPDGDDAIELFLGVGDAARPKAVTVSTNAGNTVAGRVDLSGVPQRIRSAGQPRWVLGQIVEGGVRFDVFHKGRAQRTFLVADDGAVLFQPSEFDGVPIRDVAPVGRDTGLGGDGIQIGEGTAPSAEAAPVGRTSADEVPPTSTLLAHITVDGDLSLQVLGERAALGEIPGPFLLDARPVLLADGTVAVLADPTQEYPHGVLGDRVEGGAVAIVEVGPDGAPGSVVRRLEPAAGRVIEQRRVLSTELDGMPAVVVTTSSPDDGARVEVWTTDGHRRVVGEAIGAGRRWRHVIGVAELPGGGIEIAEVITPHLGRTASFLRVEGDRLVQVSAAPDAIASHVLGERNLDRGALVDVDGDGRRDLVGPAADGDGLAWVIAGEDTANQTDAGHVMSTNLAMVTRADGSVVLAYGTTDGILVIHG